MRNGIPVVPKGTPFGVIFDSGLQGDNYISYVATDNACFRRGKLVPAKAGNKLRAGWVPTIIWFIFIDFSQSLYYVKVFVGYVLSSLKSMPLIKQK